MSLQVCTTTPGSQLSFHKGHPYQRETQITNCSQTAAEASYQISGTLRFMWQQRQQQQQQQKKKLANPKVLRTPLARLSGREWRFSPLFWNQFPPVTSWRPSNKLPPWLVFKKKATRSHSKSDKSVEHTDRLRFLSSSAFTIHPSGLED